MCNHSSDQDSSLEDERAKEDRPSSSHLSTHSGIIQTKKNLAMTCRSREKVHYHSEWKTRQDVVHWMSLARAPDKGLQFWQTRSHARIENSLSTPRPAPKVVSRVPGNGSSSNSTSSRTHLRVHLRAPGNWCRERNKVHQQTTQNYLATRN